MSNTKSVTVYQQRDNAFSLTLRKQGALLTQLEMESITKFEIKYNGTYYNSVDNAAGFERDNANSKVTIKPYALNLAAGDDEDVEFIVYDATDYIHGYVWDTFRMIVKADAVPAS